MPTSRATVWLLMLSASLAVARPAPAAASVSPAAPAASPATAPLPLSPKLRARAEELRRVALGDDIEAACAAVLELRTMGLPARRLLLDVLRTVLARDKAMVEKNCALVGDPAKLRAAEQQLADLRAKALDNIPKLEKGEPVRLAREYFEQIAAIYRPMSESLGFRLGIADAVSRRVGFLPVWRSVAPATDLSFNPAAEKRLDALAEKALGMSVATIVSLPAMGRGNEPRDPAQRQLWYYRACRRIEAWNQTIRPLMDDEEWRNAVCVNAYREALGLVPYELDARLIQSARRHSKEMVDLKYFAHDSPSSASPFQRMRNAGYDAAYGENIAHGPTNGERVFWMWFDSPGHHKNMASAGSTALGVGRWRSHWTQNMGRGARLMLMTPEQRQKIAVHGAVLAPDAPPQASPRPPRP